MSGDPSNGGDVLEADADIEWQWAWDDSRPSVAVIRAITAISGDEITECPPLFTALDPDALDRLLLDRGTSRRQGDLSVQFHYHGYEITIHSYGVIRVESLASRNTTSKESNG